MVMFSKFIHCLYVTCRQMATKFTRNLHFLLHQDSHHMLVIMIYRGLIRMYIIGYKRVKIYY